MVIRGPCCRAAGKRRRGDGRIAGASGSAHPDWSTVETWADGSALRVTTLYDQSGNGNHALQDTAGRQPAIVTAKARGGLQPVTHDGGEWFVLPDGLAGNGRNVSVISVQRRQSIGSSGNTNQCQWMLGSAWNAGGAMSVLAIISTGMRLLTSSTFRTLGAYARSQPEVIALSSGASGVTFYRDGVTTDSSVNNAGTYVGGLIGHGGSGYNWWGDTFFHAVYDGALEGTDMAALRGPLNGIFGIEPLEDTSLPLLLAPGNSIVLGTGSSYGMNNLWFTEALLSSPIHIMNCGVFGQLAATVYSSRNSYISRYDAARPANIIVAPEPTNDIASSATGTDCWNDYTKPFIDEAVAAGFKVLLPTIIKRTGFDATRNGYKDDFNTLARAYADETDIFLVDYAADDASLFLADGTHPTSDGYATMAVRQAAAIEAALES